MIEPITPKQLAAFLAERARIESIAEQLGRALAAIREEHLFIDETSIRLDEDDVEVNTHTTRYGGDSDSISYPVEFLHDPEGSLAGAREKLATERAQAAEAQRIVTEQKAINQEIYDRQLYERLHKRFGAPGEGEGEGDDV